MRKTHCNASGMTLVEMLVVMILVSLVITLVVQGLGNALSLYAKVQGRQKHLYSQSMAQSWFREAVNSAAPNRLDQKRFVGDAERLSFDTFRPLADARGVITPVSWSIGEAPPYALRYRQGERAFELMLEDALAVSSRPKFVYLDNQNGEHDLWPRSDNDFELPDAVELRFADFTVTARIYSHRHMLFYVDEVNFGRENL